MRNMSMLFLCFIAIGFASDQIKPTQSANLLLTSYTLGCLYFLHRFLFSDYLRDNPQLQSNHGAADC